MSTFSEPPPAGDLAYAVSVDATLDAVAEPGATPHARDVWKALGAAGLLRALMPETPEPGGPARLRPARVDALVRALDRRLPMGVALPVGVQLASALPLLWEGAATESLASAAELAAAGDAVTALGATDAGAAGSDLVALTTSVELHDDLVVVRGGKRWITSATFADQVLVLARHRPGTHFTSFTWVLVPASARGVSVEAAGTDLLAGAGLGHFGFRDVEVPRDHLIGRLGDGLARFGRHMVSERYTSARWAAAVMRRVLDDTRRRLAGRTVGGTSLWDRSSVRERLARCVLEHQRLEAWCDHVARELDAPSAPTTSMMLKAGAAASLETVLAECAQLHGADGLETGGIQHLRAEASMFGIAGGAANTLIAGLADQVERLLEEPAP